MKVGTVLTTFEPMAIDVSRPASREHKYCTECHIRFEDDENDSETFLLYYVYDNVLGQFVRLEINAQNEEFEFSMATIEFKNGTPTNISVMGHIYDDDLVKSYKVEAEIELNIKKTEPYRIGLKGKFPSSNNNASSLVFKDITVYMQPSFAEVPCDPPYLEKVWNTGLIELRSSSCDGQQTESKNISIETADEDVETALERLVTYSFIGLDTLNDAKLDILEANIPLVECN